MALNLVGFSNGNAADTPRVRTPRAQVAWPTRSRGRRQTTLYLLSIWQAMRSMEYRAREIGRAQGRPRRDHCAQHASTSGAVLRDTAAGGGYCAGQLPFIGRG